MLGNPTEAICVLFTGEYEHQIDAKQRMAIPAEVRSRMSSETDGDALYLVPGANGALWLWPEKTFERMASVVDEQNAGDPLYRPMAENFQSIAFQAALDLALHGADQPSGYTEPLLHAARRKVKARDGK